MFVGGVVNGPGSVFVVVVGAVVAVDDKVVGVVVDVICVGVASYVCV
jgi:hypothetical protein